MTLVLAITMFRGTGCVQTYHINAKRSTILTCSTTNNNILYYYGNLTIFYLLQTREIQIIQQSAYVYYNNMTIESILLSNIEDDVTTSKIQFFSNICLWSICLDILKAFFMYAWPIPVHKKSISKICNFKLWRTVWCFKVVFSTLSKRQCFFTFV